MPDPFPNQPDSVGPIETASALDVSSAGWSAYRNDFGAFAGERLSAGANSTFQLWVPTDGGPYRLVLHCYPEESVTQKRTSGFRTQIAHLLFRVNVSKRNVDRFVFGAQFPTSLPFEVISPSQTLEAASDPPSS